MKQYDGNYYLGLDIGTNSVGYAVTDESYHVLNFHKKAMWGVHEFEEAQTAAHRRVERSNRRRLGRKKWRIQLLQELFAEEICKVDPGFFQRLKDSRLWPEDKTEKQVFSLFNDHSYTDATFYNDYPTIYHLRKALLTEQRPFDVRLVYLALHHLIKHRGHFLFPGSLENATSFSRVFEQWKDCMNDELGIQVECNSEKELERVLKDRDMRIRDKCKIVENLLNCDKKNKPLAAAINLMCGGTTKLFDLFNDDSLKEIEKPSISLAKESYDELRDKIEADLQERCFVIDMIKALYDWASLADILAGGEYEGTAYLSIAKVAVYEKHKKDLELLKRIIRSADTGTYRNFFQKLGENNYCAYVGYTIKNGEKLKAKKRCKYDDMKKSIKQIITTYYKDSQDKDILYILSELDNDAFLPKQVTTDNGVIPHQVNEMELNKILDNAQSYLAFLNETDENGISVREKILSIFSFRVPYYIGPLNTHGNKNAWAVRKEAGSIKPWNLEQKIDYDTSGEKFIRRMTNKCTYLIGKDVLPKNSLLYSEFMVWEEINNIKVGDNKLPTDLKQSMYDTLFKAKRRVSRKNIEDFLKSEGIDLEQDPISGIDITIKSSLASYHDFRKIFGEDVDKYSNRQMIEQLILWSTIYGQEPKMLDRVIKRSSYSEQISQEQIKKIRNLNYQGWGRLSREFLEEITGMDTETGEVFSIITALRNTSDNLMQLLGQHYTFSKAIDEENQPYRNHNQAVTYANLMENRIASPAVKRAVWRAVLIAKEVAGIMRKAPTKVFVETTRSTGEEKRTDSRKSKLIETYKAIKGEERKWVEEIENKDTSKFRDNRLFLYYTQMGRCMYTQEPIDLSQLYDRNKYDIEHIYPRSKTKDDSLDNLVLVKKQINAKKKDEVMPAEIQTKMKPFWEQLNNKENPLISDEKFKRLNRKTPFSDDELAGFINRQLVETSQSSKMVAEVMQEIFPDSAIAYVKAGNVSEFRKEKLRTFKVRSLNDYHHAKDAYLNIVAGNVYYEKFTNNPLRWLKQNKEKDYDLSHMYDFNLVKNGKTIWERGYNGSLKTIREQMSRNDIQYTWYATTNKTGQNGGFFDQNPVRKDNQPGVPLKKGLDVLKYGGYKTITPAYFSLVESEDKKGNLVRSIEAVPLYLVKQFENGTVSFEEYCTNIYGLINPRIIMKKIKKNACLVINGFPMHLRGTTGKQLLLQGAVQLCLDPVLEDYLKRIERYIQKNQERTDKNNLLKIEEYEKITREANERLYMELYRKLKETIYSRRPNNALASLENGSEKFKYLSLEEQCILLNEILWLFRCKPETANLTLIGGAKNAGKLVVNKKITGNESVILKNQSVTGLFEQTIDLLKI